ncbi:HD domain-containing protein [Bacteroidota bacterium]
MKIASEELQNLQHIALKLIEKYIPTDSMLYRYYVIHCMNVANKALEIAETNQGIAVDLQKLYLSAMWHDIGICKVNAPEIGCTGNFPYLAHGYLGREIIENEGYPEIAPICERHIGVGLTKEDIRKLNMGLPDRDTLPVTNEEKIVCLADKFYSKTKNKLDIPKTKEEILIKLSKHNKEEAFMRLWREFNMD